MKHLGTMRPISISRTISRDLVRLGVPVRPREREREKEIERKRFVSTIRRALLLNAIAFSCQREEKERRKENMS
jgi:hypothetical protein